MGTSVSKPIPAPAVPGPSLLPTPENGAMPAAVAPGGCMKVCGDTEDLGHGERALVRQKEVVWEHHTMCQVT